MILTVAIGALVFWIAFDGGSYALESRATLAIATWWLILMAVVLGLWPLARPGRAALVTGALIAALGILTVSSIVWAESAERAFTEFNRVALYLAVFLVAVLAGTRGNVARWADGIAVGITATGLLALASRLFPDVLPAGEVAEFLPSAYTRLSWPMEYWNGLAILIGLAFPLLLRIASEQHSVVWRGLAVAALPPLCASMYLTSSRGGFATALIGTVAFVVLTPRRWTAVAAIAVGGLASAGAIAILDGRDELVDDPAASVAVSQGRTAAVLIAVISLGAGAVYALAARFAPTVSFPSLAGRVAAALVVVAALVGVAASDPVERFDTFREPPVSYEEDDFVRAHLTSGNGSGRWQFWESAVDQFEDEPLVGQGAGSYEAWWAQNGSLAMFIRDAHSLYLETLGELGILGFLLIAAVFLLALVTGLRRLFGAGGEERVLVAALTATFVGYAVAAGIDWMWELTAVSVIGVALLGLLTGPATDATARPRLLREPDARRGRDRRRFVAAVGALACAWLLICAQAIPFLADIKISDSQAAARSGNGEQALEDAAAARNLQPWAASPYLQLAQVEEATGDLDEARRWIGEAIERDSLDWRLWLVAARLETKAGHVAEARRSLSRAAELNPRSPLFANVR
jgi:hypothetical protein